MAVQPPTQAKLQALAASFHLHFDDAEMATMHSLVTGALASYDLVDALAEDDRPTPPDRAYGTPGVAQDPLNAWYVTTDIEGAPSGPLAGRRVAIKDNIMVPESR